MSNPLNGGPSRLLAATGLALALAPSIRAQDPAPAELFYDRDVYEAGDVVVTTIRGEPGHTPVMFVSLGPGPTHVPVLGGEMGVTFGPGLIIMFLPPLQDADDGSGAGELKVPWETTCDDPALGLTLFTQLVMVDMGAGQVSSVSPPAALEIVQGDCGDCPSAAESDAAVSNSGSQHALWLPGIGTDFTFEGGLFTEREDGAAYLTGLVSRESDPGQAFSVNVVFEGRISVTDPTHPPTGSPKLELVDAAYADQGGPIDPSAWHYYETTTGTLTGMRDFAGARLSVSRMGPAFQVGLGANGKNTHFGASGWLDVEVLAQPDDGTVLPATSGDFNLDLGGDCVSCPSEAGDHVLTLPGIDKDYVFEEGGLFIDNQCGWATLAGVVVATDDPTHRWILDVIIEGKVSPGAQYFPPPDSPKKELPADLYVENGGPIDPTSWWYYHSINGTMIGLDGYDGASIQLSRFGPAFQIGVGANGKNTNFGASAWLDVNVLLQPTTGEVLPDDPAHGDFNMDLDDCP